MGFFGQSSRAGYLPIKGDNSPPPSSMGKQIRKRQRHHHQAQRISRNRQMFLALFLSFFAFIFVVLLIRSTRHKLKGPYVLRQVDPSSNQTEITVNIRQGTLLGKRLQTRDGREYLAFLGIPYAKPPVNELRFKPPEEAEGWTGTLNATFFAPVCTQDGKQGGSTGSEDCLYLNVFTPKTADELKQLGRRDGRRRRAKNLMPVMVYIHGGGPGGTCVNNGAEYILDEDVILVNFSYRLGVFGMLNVHTSAARGNQGLKDQALALKWVQSNIAAFGGDKQRVLIFGESSGSSSISAHLVSPMSKGLFSRAICQSGTILDSAVFSPDPVKNALDFGAKLNCSGGNETQTQLTVDTLMECLMNMEPEKLVVTIPDISVDRSFMASVETGGDGETEDAFLTDTALHLFQSGAVSNVIPVMLGVNNQENIGISLAMAKIPQLLDDLNTNWVEKAKDMLHLVPNPNNFTTDPNEIVDRIHDFYFGAGNNITTATVQNFTDMSSDRDLTHPTYMTAYFVQQAYQQQTTTTTPSNVYLYYLTEQVPSSLWVRGLSKVVNISIEEINGAGHVDELQFLFPHAGYKFPEITADSPHYNYSKMLVHLWASFADTGVPDTAGYGGEWLPISEPRPFSWYDINGNDSRMTDALNDRMSFWDSFNITDLYF